MAHVPAHILDSVAKCGDRVQGDAGAASPFVIALDTGCLHPGSYSGEACSTSRRIVTGLFARSGRRITPGRAESCRHIVFIKRTQKGRETRPFRALDGFEGIRLNLLETMAGTTGLEPAASAVTGQQ